MTENASPRHWRRRTLLGRRCRGHRGLLEALRDVVDPELGINVVDLGLVYGVDVDEATGSPRST